MGVLFLAGVKLRHFLGLVTVVGASLAMIAVASPYRIKRLISFLDPWADPFNSGFQLVQSLIAIGSGGIHGKGFTHGTQGKFGFVPEHHTDFIFSVLGEEWGFIGVIIVLGLYLFLIIQAMTFAKHARDRGGTFLVISLTAFIIFHVIINVAMKPRIR